MGPNYVSTPGWGIRLESVSPGASGQVAKYLICRSQVWETMKHAFPDWSACSP
jgi:hypothetical protein